MNLGPTGVDWTPKIEHDGLALTVSGPDGFYLRQEFPAGGDAVFHLFDKAGNALADGSYKYELTATPVLGAGQRRALAEARASGDLAAERRLEAEVPRLTYQAGFFAIAGGRLVSPDESEEAPVLVERSPTLATRATVLTNADGVIRNSLCVGFDCPNSPSFSDTTILMMENNTRIKFDDTSSTSSFPRNDWEIEANSNLNGGANYLGFNDCGQSSQGGCATDLVFAVEAGVRSSALYVESDGDIGIGTNNPVADVHVKTGNTPTLRLEQDTSSGFTAQTWDVAGNESNFFVRDVTNGSQLPFRIEPGTASNTFYLDSNERVGIGTSAPTSKLHVRSTNGSAQALVEEASGTAATRKLLRVVNNGRVDIEMENTNAGSNTTWQFIAGIADGGGNTNGQGFAISRSGSGVTEFEIQGDGDVFVGGALAHASSRALKENFRPVDSQEVLDRVARLPLTTWTYKKDSRSATHLGPVAEDFYATFGLGESAEHIATGDTAGVALASIQALHRLVTEKDREIADLKARLASIEALIQGLTE